MNNNLNDNIIFEEVVMSVLKKEAAALRKKVYAGKEIDFIMYQKNVIMFDGYAPEGIFDDYPTFIEINFSSKTIDFKKFTERKFEKYFNEIFFDKFKILYISLSEDSDIYENDYMVYERYSFLNLVKLLRKYPIELNLLTNLLSKNIIKDFENKKNITKKDLQQNSKENVNLLKEKISQNKISVVLGTGVSFSFGAKSWNDLVTHLYNSLGENKFDNKKEALKKIGEDNLSKTQYIKSVLDASEGSDIYANALYDGLYSKYDKDNDYQDSSLYSLCNVIKKDKIRKILTYNYDNFLEIMMSKNKIDNKIMISEEDYLDNCLPIYHLHGFLPFNSKKEEKKDRSKDIVLSEDDYFKLYNDHSHWQVAIQLTTFKDDICLFIGNSITDYNEKRLLNITRQKFKMHFAILIKDNLTTEDILKINAYFYKNFNVKIIWVDNSSDIPKMIEDIFN